MSSERFVSSRPRYVPDLISLHEVRIKHGVYPEAMVPVVEELLAEIKRLGSIDEAAQDAMARLGDALDSRC